MAEWTVTTEATVTRQRIIEVSTPEELFTQIHDHDAEGTWGDVALGPVEESDEKMISWKLRDPVVGVPKVEVSPAPHAGAHGGLTIRRLLHELQELPAGATVKNGFVNAHSWRGSYSELAVEPAEVTVGAMIEELELAVGHTVFHGYKGGDYRMTLDTEVHLAKYGEIGVPITPHWVALVQLEAGGQ